MWAQWALSLQAPTRVLHTADPAHTGPAHRLSCTHWGPAHQDAAHSWSCTPGTCAQLVLYTQVLHIRVLHTRVLGRQLTAGLRQGCLTVPDSKKYHTLIGSRQDTGASLKHSSDRSGRIKMTLSNYDTLRVVLKIISP